MDGWHLHAARSRDDAAIASSQWRCLHVERLRLGVYESMHRGGGSPTLLSPLKTETGPGATLIARIMAAKVVPARRALVIRGDVPHYRGGGGSCSTRANIRGHYRQASAYSTGSHVASRSSRCFCLLLPPPVPLPLL